MEEMQTIKLFKITYEQEDSEVNIFSDITDLYFRDRANAEQKFKELSNVYKKKYPEEKGKYEYYVAVDKGTWQFEITTPSPYNATVFFITLEDFTLKIED